MTLTNYTELIDVATEKQYIAESDVALLQEWKKDPKNWNN